MGYRSSIAAALTTAGGSLTTGHLNTVTGDAGIAFLQTLSAQPFLSFGDTTGNSWTPITGLNPFATTISGVSFRIYVYQAQNITGTTGETYTFAVSNGPIYLAAQIQMFSGRLTSGTLCGTPQTYTNTSFVTSHAGPTATGIAGDSFACYMLDGSTSSDTFTAGGGYTLASSLLGSANTYFVQASQYQNNVLGTIAAPWTTANFVSSAGIVVPVHSTPITGATFPFRRRSRTFLPVSFQR